jgi:hypothetical protein
MNTKRQVIQDSLNCGLIHVLGTPRTILSDTISNKINELSAAFSSSDLWDNIPLRRKVLSGCCPKILLTQLGGIDVVVSRIPGIVWL